MGLMTIILIYNPECESLLSEAAEVCTACFLQHLVIPGSMKIVKALIYTRIYMKNIAGDDQHACNTGKEGMHTFFCLKMIKSHAFCAILSNKIEKNQWKP